LPNDEQVTTARDQALLGRAIQERFPGYYRYFAMSSFTYHGQTMRRRRLCAAAFRPARPRRSGPALAGW
jgi:D-alanyl-D-alanine carboxypeptidase